MARAATVLALAALLSPAVAAAQEGTVAAARPDPLDLPEVALEVPTFLRPSDGGLTADEAARRAAATAPQVQRAEAAQAQAQAQADEAVSAFVPRFDLSGSYSRINEVEFPPFEFAGMAFDNPFPQILDLWALRGSVQVAVSDYFLVILPAYDGAQGFLDAAAAQREVQAQAAAFRGREAYYAYVRALARLWVAEEAVTSLEASVADVEALVRAGVRARADYAQVRSALAQSQAAVVRARAGVRLAERALRRTLHLAPGSPLRIGEDLFGPLDRTPPPAQDDLVDEARDERPEVRAIRSALEARRALVSSRIGSLFPSLSLTGSLETSSPNPRVIPQSADIVTTWAIGASISWSPNDTAVGIHRVRQAEAEVAQAEEDLAALEDGLVLEAAQALSSYTSAEGSLDALQEQLVAAEVALADRRALLNAGAGTTTELLRAQLDQIQARLGLIDARVSLRLARDRIDRVRGRALPTDHP